MMNDSSRYGVVGLSVFLVSLLGWACSRVEPYTPRIDVAEMASSEPATVVTEVAEAVEMKDKAAASIADTAKQAEAKMAAVAAAASETIAEKVAEVKEAIPAIEAGASNLAKSAGEAVAGEANAVKESLEKVSAEAVEMKDKAAASIAETAKQAEANVADVAAAAKETIAEKVAEVKEAIPATEAGASELAKSGTETVEMTDDAVKAGAETAKKTAPTVPVAAVVTPPAAKPWVGAKLGDDQPVVGVIIDNSPAATAGLKPGDVIESVNGKKIANTKELVSKIVASKPGDKLELVVTRDSESVPLALTLGANPATSSAAPAK